jgi:hypothetical protein
VAPLKSNAPFASVVASRLGVNAFGQPVDFYTQAVATHPADPARKRRLARACYYLAVVGGRWHAGPSPERLAVVRRSLALYDELRRNTPGHVGHALEQIQLCAHVALLLSPHPGSDREMEVWCEQARQALKELAVSERNPAAKNVVRDYYLARWALEMRRNDAVSGLLALHRACELDEAVRPSVANDYASAVGLSCKQVYALLRAGRHDDAVKQAELLAGVPAIAAEALYAAAAVFSVTAGASKDLALREKYAARSVGLLRAAFATGFARDPVQKGAGLLGDPIEWLDRDADLAAVRGRDDYRTFRAALSRKR